MTQGLFLGAAQTKKTHKETEAGREEGTFWKFCSGLKHLILSLVLIASLPTGRVTDQGKGQQQKECWT